MDPTLLPAIIGIKRQLVMEPDYKLLWPWPLTDYLLCPILCPSAQIWLKLLPLWQENLLAVLDNIISFVAINILP